MRGNSLRPDLHKVQIMMDAAPDGTVLIDQWGHAWQKGAYFGYWYRAFDSDHPASSFQLAQQVGSKPTFVQPVVSSTERKES